MREFNINEFHYDPNKKTLMLKEVLDYYMVPSCFLIIGKTRSIEFGWGVKAPVADLGAYQFSDWKNEYKVVIRYADILNI
jgi:hypothetical protein